MSFIIIYIFFLLLVNKRFLTIISLRNTLWRHCNNNAIIKLNTFYVTTNDFTPLTYSRAFPFWEYRGLKALTKCVIKALFELYHCVTTKEQVSYIKQNFTFPIYLSEIPLGSSPDLSDRRNHVHIKDEK